MKPLILLAALALGLALTAGAADLDGLLEFGWREGFLPAQPEVYAQLGLNDAQQGRLREALGRARQEQARIQAAIKRASKTIASASNESGSEVIA